MYYLVVAHGIWTFCAHNQNSRSTKMKACNFVISLISATVLLGVAGAASAGNPCATTNAVASSETTGAEHDSVYDSLNGITNEAPVDKATRLAWKKRTADGAGANAVAYTEASGAEHDSVYDSLNGITNEAPVDKASRLAWKKRDAIAKVDCN
jgi:hypothetical protein